MRLFLFLGLLVPAFGQIADIATDSAGQVLLFATRFRLQTEEDVRSESKIYRWENGVWSRLATYVPSGGPIQGGLFDPFVAANGSIYGWMDMPSHGIFPLIRPHANAVLRGFELPDGFPREQFHVSANGRYFVGADGGIGFPMWKSELLDGQTGVRTPLPDGSSSHRVASDGTVAYFQDGEIVIGGRELITQSPATGFTLSDDGRWVLTVEEGRIRLYPAQGGSAVDIGPALATGRTGPNWSLGNANVAFLSAREDGKLTRLNAWNIASRQAALIAESPEPFVDISIGADGFVVWAVTETNRLLRFDLRAGTREEILPPLGRTSVSQTRPDGVAVPGSALRLNGVYTREQRVLVNGEPWPISDVTESTYWFQVPWEWRGPSTPVPFVLRAPGHPFEDTGTVAYNGDFFPDFPYRSEPNGFGTLIAAHSDFRGVVSEADPARGGETIHVYMTGLGALAREVPTGDPGPLDAVPIARSLACVGHPSGSPGSAEPLTVHAAIYAGGMIGIYQVDVTVPLDAPSGQWVLRCGADGSEAAQVLFTRP